MKNIKPSIYNELDNVKANVLKLAEQLNLSLPQLCEIANISYKSLWRFMNNSNIPNYDILEKLASFFNMSVSELLVSLDKQPVTNYFKIPITNLSDLENFLDNRTANEYPCIHIDQFIAHNSFAIKINKNEKDEIYVFKPSNECVKGILLFKSNNQTIIGKVFQIAKQSIQFYDLTNSSKYTHTIGLDNIQVIAVAVKLIIQDNLLRATDHDSK